MRIVEVRTKVHDAREAMASTFNFTRAHGLTFDQFMSRVLVARAMLNKCPKWAIKYLDGYEDARMQHWREHVLAYGYKLESGETVSTWKSHWNFYEKLGYSVSEAYHRAIWTGHFWPMGDATLVSEQGHMKPFSLYYRDDLVPKGSNSPFEEPVYAVMVSQGHQSLAEPEVLKSGILFDDAVALSKRNNTIPAGRGTDEYTFVRLMHGYNKILWEDTMTITEGVP